MSVPPGSPLPYTDTKPQGSADFYYAINATFRFILARRGEDGWRRYLADLGRDQLRDPGRGVDVAEGPAALVGHPPEERLVEVVADPEGRGAPLGRGHAVLAQRGIRLATEIAFIGEFPA